MAESDHYFKKLMQNKERFADLYNAVVFQGEQVLKPENLEYIPDESGIVILDHRGKKKVIQRRRDVLMKAGFSSSIPWNDSGEGSRSDIYSEVSREADPYYGYFMLTAAEGQDQIHYAMPVRSLLYDALDYVAQVDSVTLRHKQEEQQHLQGAEYLSGFGKCDKIVPVVSLVVYLGKTAWDGPASLYEMMGMDDREPVIRRIRQILPDYRINLVSPQDLDHMERFRTSLQYIFGMLKYNGEKNKLYEYTKENQKAIRSMDSDSMMAALAFLGEQKRLMKALVHSDSEKEEWDLCKAIDDLIADGKEEGRKEGREEGKQEGKQEGECIKLITQVMKKWEKGQSAHLIAEDLLEPLDMIEIILETIRTHSGAQADQIYGFLTGVRSAIM